MEYFLNPLDLFMYPSGGEPRGEPRHTTVFNDTLTKTVRSKTEKKPFVPFFVLFFNMKIPSKQHPH